MFVMKSETTVRQKWLEYLTDEDLMFVKRLILASGSLKEVAATYQISYPTVRLRLDRLIEKIKVVDSVEPMSRFERTLRAAYADGKLDATTLKSLLSAHREDTGTEDETTSHRA
jgi:hypothetical protein